MAEAILAAILGACGGGLYELLGLARFLRGHGHYPWSPRRRPRVVRFNGALRRYESFPVYLTTVVIRVVVGAGVAAALTAAGPLNNLAAVIAGVAGYSIIDRWAETAPVHDGSTAVSATRSSSSGAR